MKPFQNFSYTSEHELCYPGDVESRINPYHKLIGEDITDLYSARWEVERLFKELKDVYHIDQVESANLNVVKCLKDTWIA